jgi:hypothetical protein
MQCFHLSYFAFPGPFVPPPSLELHTLQFFWSRLYRLSHLYEPYFLSSPFLYSPLASPSSHTLLVLLILSTSDPHLRALPTFLMPVIPCPAVLLTRPAFLLAQPSWPVLSPALPFACLPLAHPSHLLYFPHACPPSSTHPACFALLLPHRPHLSSFPCLTSPTHPQLGSVPGIRKKSKAKSH